MIKGLMITPPVLGRIAIGRMIEREGKRFPIKDNQFTITSQIQNQEGWILHPVDERLRGEDQKLRSIPIRLPFNEPELNLRAEYSLFDRETGRPLCVGNGEQARRMTNEGMQVISCPSPMQCKFGQSGYCKPYGRLNVLIEGEDELGTFIFRTTGFNSIRTLTARMRYYQALSNGLLAYLPLTLKLRGKSTTMSYRTPIYYVDIEIREGMSIEEALADAQARYSQRKEAGFNQSALDDAARMGFANGAFEDSEDDALDVIEEFYPETDNQQQAQPTSLHERLAQSASA